MKNPRPLLALLAVLALVAAACGGDDDDDATDDGGDAATEADGAGDDAAEAVGDGDASGNGGELALGDPCELVDAATVGGAVGAEVEGVVTGVDDGLPGAACLWSDADGVPLVQVGFTPGGGSFVSSNNAGGSDFSPIDDLGDEAFAFSGIEIQVRTGDDQIIVTLLSSDLDVDAAARPIAEAAVAAIG